MADEDNPPSKKTLTQSEIEVINKSIIDHLKEQEGTLDSVLIAGAGGSSK